MEKNSTINRLYPLDGVRGIAILLVLLTHINVFYSQTLAKIIPQFLIDPLFGNGATGVSLLFVLSGFLMMYIYPNPKSPSLFLQKRYTRIFPLFLSLTSFQMIIRLFPSIVWYEKFLILLFIALSAHFIWVSIVQKTTAHIAKTLFYGFLLLQFVTAVFYGFWIMRQPPLVFHQQLPFFVRETTVWLVNSTLTLPLGNYVPMLDGVYWSLASEIFFYVLYPFLCIPLIGFFVQKSKVVKTIGIVAVLFFFLGLDILAHNLFLLSMIQLPLCFYFVTGIILGYLYRNHEYLFQKVPSPLFVYLSVVLFFTALFTKNILFKYLNQPNAAWIHILWAFPITFGVALALNEKTLLSKILRSKILLFFGTISYSLYLIHVPILQITSTILSQNVFSITVVSAAIILVGSLLYFLLEKPYFTKRKSEEKQEYSRFYLYILKKPAIVIVLLLLLSFIGVFAAFQSKFNFFSVEKNYTKNVFESPILSKDTNEISMLQNPSVKLDIPASGDNLGILSMHITRKTAENIPSSHQVLLFKIKEKGSSKWYSQSSFELAEIADSKNHLFGFPFIKNSKGKTYLVELSLTSPYAADYIVIDTTGSAVTGIYNADKRQLVKNPGLFLSFFYLKLTNIFRDEEAQKTILLLLPFTLFVICQNLPLLNNRKQTNLKSNY